jgi:phosphoribosylformylglycinamidine cyclo-ligase
MTYAKAGVDIDRKSESIAALVGQLNFARHGVGKPLVLEGHYAGLIDFGDVALTLCTDGVGTKLIVANQMKKWDTVGIDCIAMNVNDTICLGAEPMAFVDYLAVDQPDKDMTAQIGAGLERGAEMANMTIVGGEIAILPEIVSGFDLAGTCLGHVKKNAIITGEGIRPGDVVVGLPSTGIHSNGLTLARKIFEENGLAMTSMTKGLSKKVGMELLEPTAIYVREVLEIVRTHEVRGMANITGGGLRNLLRLNKDLGFEISDPMPRNPIFAVLQDLGGVTDHEMYQTFNMGMGFSIVVPESEGDEVAESVGSGARVVGRAVEGRGVTVPSMDLSYTTY